MLPLPRIREIARSAGAEISERFGHLRWNVAGLSNERRARTVAERMRRAPGRLSTSSMFVDRRSFTLFSEKAKPEDVGEMLADYR